MKEAAPHEADAFSAWHEEQTSLDRESGITYDDISICPEELKRWYEVMLSHFPAMNGRDAESSQLAYTMMLGDIPFVQARLEAHLTNYAVKSNLIFGECSWVLAKEVYELARTTAAECGLVFFDYSFGRVYFSETDVLRLPYEDVEYEKYSLSLPLIIPMDYAFSWIEGAQGYIYGKPRRQIHRTTRYSLSHRKRKCISPLGCDGLQMTMGRLLPTKTCGRLWGPCLRFWLSAV